jgi:hypothetical protein
LVAAAATAAARCSCCWRPKEVRAPDSPPIGAVAEVAGMRARAMGGGVMPCLRRHVRYSS